jgi:hypothetical protein
LMTCRQMTVFSATMIVVSWKNGFGSYKLRKVLINFCVCIHTFIKLYTFHVHSNT